MSPYTAKIVHRGQRLLYVDAFAGPGRFEDGPSGSPIIICQAVEKYAKGRAQAVFVNKDPQHHEQLKNILIAGGWDKFASPVLGDAANVLRGLASKMSNESIFLYIDPFGLQCEFDVLEPFLQRNKAYSTELLINLSMPVIHRLAARDSFLSGNFGEHVPAFHQKLTRTLGGDYWKDILLAKNGLDTKTREKLIVDGYMHRLSETDYLRYTGYCPIQVNRESRTKYFMVFASPHPDAMLLFNDEMLKAFNEFMHEEETRGTLFAGQPWTEWHNTNELKKLIIRYVRQYPGRTRLELWPKIVSENFMRFTSSEYKKAVSELVDMGSIVCPTPYPSPTRKTKRMNDDCVLVPKAER